MKTFFLSRLLREKVLLLGLVMLVAVTWLSSAIGRTTRFNRAFSFTSVELASQQGWIDKRVSIESEARASIEHLDPAKTFDGVRLQAEVAAIANRTGVVNFSADNVQSDRTSQFTKHWMQLQIRNAEYATLVKFYLELSKQAPYIGIEQFKLSASNFKHSTSIRVFSVETPK
ncbi:MAG: hypothetical protein IPP19_05945 [Verrucomicrobia bacterium]|nr:hypothetical protein [Verrucomicrobiota bacterium]